jgi:hypothetical protein
MNRFVLADTEKLHLKMAEMAQRIRQLEDALAILQAEISNESHHLLRDELLSVKYGLEIQKDATENEGDEEVLDSLGTLTINGHGEATYFGAGSEVGSFNTAWSAKYSYFLKTLFLVRLAPCLRPRYILHNSVDRLEQPRTLNMVTMRILSRVTFSNYRYPSHLAR